MFANLKRLFAKLVGQSPADALETSNVSAEQPPRPQSKNAYKGSGPFQDVLFEDMQFLVRETGSLHVTFGAITGPTDAVEDFVARTSYRLAELDLVHVVNRELRMRMIGVSMAGIGMVARVVEFTFLREVTFKCECAGHIGIVGAGGAACLPE